MITPKKYKKTTGKLKVGKAAPGKDVFGNDLKSKKKFKIPKERKIPRGFPASSKSNTKEIPKSFPTKSKSDTLTNYKNEGMSDAVFLPNIKKKKKK